jgi:hypothetical protein
MAKGASHHATAEVRQPQLASAKRVGDGDPSALPRHLSGTGASTGRLGAWTRTRGIPAIDALLQALLCYVLCARSLRQLGAWATVVGLGSISDRAWSKRIRHSTAWALWLLGALIRPTSCGRSGPAQPLRIRVIDASMVRMRIPPRVFRSPPLQLRSARAAFGSGGHHR